MIQNLVLSGLIIAVLIPVSMEVANSNAAGLWSQLQNDLPTAFARAFDMAAIRLTPAAVATWVLTRARAAVPFAPRAEPALKPNQPNHSSPAPSITSGRLWGRIGSRPKPDRKSVV